MRWGGGEEKGVERRTGSGEEGARGRVRKCGDGG